MIARVFITGFVQGVGYRQFVKHSARRIGLAGWVRNLPDNRVEAIFQGSEKQIKNIISICRKGPFLSEVKDIVVEWKDQSTGTFKTFEILH